MHHRPESIDDLCARLAEAAPGDVIEAPPDAVRIATSPQDVFGLFRREPSDEEMAAFGSRQAERDRERKEAEARLAAIPPGWKPIETAPFADLDKLYGIDSAMLVSDGHKRAIVTPSERFGTPLIAEPRPAWWYKWELRDELESESELYGKPEVDFMPTMWAPLIRP